MNKNLWLLAVAQGLFLTNNVTFIAINGLVGLQLAPYGWMATLPVMGYVVGGALSTPLVAHSQARWGRKVSAALLSSSRLGARKVLLRRAKTCVSGPSCQLTPSSARRLNQSPEL